MGGPAAQVSFVKDDPYRMRGEGRSVSCLVEVVVVVMVLVVVVVFVPLYHLSDLAFVQDDCGQVSDVLFFHHCPWGLESFAHLVRLLGPLLVFLVSLLRLHGEVRKVWAHPRGRRSHRYRCSRNGFTPDSSPCINRSRGFALSLWRFHKVPVRILTPQPLLYLRQLCIGSFH